MWENATLSVATVVASRYSFHLNKLLETHPTNRNQGKRTGKSAKTESDWSKSGENKLESKKRTLGGV
jgi:hypothetical protein